jgi:hypothetical protein
LRGTGGAAFARAAQIAFIDGMRLAAVVGIVLALGSSVVVLRNLPAHPAHADAIDEDEADEVEAELAFEEASGLSA